MWGAASPERLTFFVNRVFIEMNFSPWRPNHTSSASYPWNYKKRFDFTKIACGIVIGGDITREKNCVNQKN